MSNLNPVRHMRVAPELLLVCIRQKSIRSQFRTTWSQVFSQCESQHGITGEHRACNFSTSICWAAPNFRLNLWQTCAGTLPWPWAPTAECGTECGRVRPRSRTHIYLLIHHVLMASDLLLCVFTLLHSQVHFFSFHLNKADSPPVRYVDMHWHIVRTRWLSFQCSYCSCFT